MEYTSLPSDKNGFAQIEARGTVIHSHLTGTFQKTHLAAAMALGQWLNLPADRCAKAIAGYVPQNNRAEWRETAKNRVLLDAYNANPSSTLASLQAFAHRSDLQKPMVILGDMFELGEWAATEHQAILDWLAQEAPHLDVWTVGAHYAGCKTNGKVQTFPTTDEAHQALQEASFAGRTVLIKGSRGMALEALLPAL
jgi:UDP-N-acetylmuramoyl-tripeptide--D-alanyl-D-alanine ligase